jgi:hypothetical protein
MTATLRGFAAVRKTTRSPRTSDLTEDIPAVGANRRQDA